MKRYLLFSSLSVFLCGAFPASAAAEKPVVMTMLVANTWPSGYSEIWLVGSPAPIHFISNIDPNVFGGSVEIETPDAIYDLIIVGARWSQDEVTQGQADGSIDARGVPNEWPQELPSRGAAAQFVALHPSSSVAGSADYAALDSLHRYYQNNRERLETEARQREIDGQIAAAAEAARRAAAGPLVGPPVTFERVDYSNPTPTPSE